MSEDNSENLGQESTSKFHWEGDATLVQESIEISCFLRVAGQHFFLFRNKNSVSPFAYTNMTLFRFQDATEDGIMRVECSASESQSIFITAATKQESEALLKSLRRSIESIRYASGPVRGCYCQKKCRRKFRPWVNRYFILKDLDLCYSLDEQDFTVRGKFKLNQAVITKHKEDKYDSGISIQLPASPVDGERTLALRFPSPDTRDVWLRTLQSVAVALDMLNDCPNTISPFAMREFADGTVGRSRADSAEMLTRSASAPPAEVVLTHESEPSDDKPADEDIALPAKQ